MNKLSKEKRNQLILVGLAFLIVVVGLWFSLIRYQQEHLSHLRSKQTSDEAKLAKIHNTIESSQSTEANLITVSNKLASQEQDMASGDQYAWMVNFIRKFKQSYDVDIPQFRPGGVSEENLLPNFPYKQVSVTISGTAYYFDLGRFVADFENRYPTSRILNLELAPASASRPEGREKLAFRMEVVTLVKPSRTLTQHTP